MRVATRVRMDQGRFEVTVTNLSDWTWTDVRVLYVHDEPVPGTDPEDASVAEWAERELGFDAKALLALSAKRHLSRAGIASIPNPGDGPHRASIAQPIPVLLTALDRHTERRSRYLDDWS